MFVTQLEMRNFRGISHFTLDFQKQANVLVGNNGAGKSSILDCLSILLSRMVSPICTTKGTGHIFSASDISNGEIYTKCNITINIFSEPISWPTQRGPIAYRDTQVFVPLKRLVESIRNQLTPKNKFNIPLVVYYPVNRTVLDVPLQIRKRHTFDQLSAYDQALTGKRNDFRIFFEWFRQREDIENEKYRENGRNYIDKQLEAVRKAIASFLPGYTDLRVKRAPLKMVIHKDKEELIVNQLSDGEKCLLALVGDLARRLAIANPSLEYPLNGEGVVLIDEIDLHLHPSWQRSVVENLTKTFPQCQFILTTHSPQILSHVKPECIWLLRRDKEGFHASHPEESYGQDSNRILEDIMGVPSRPPKIQKRLSRLFLEIDRGDIDKAQRTLTSIRKEIGDDPELVKANVLIRRKEIIGK